MLPVCLFHTGNKSFLSAQSSPVWVLWPFNGSFHNSSVFYYHVYKGPIVHRHEKIGDKYTLSATTTHHYFHPGISPCLAITHYLTTYEDIHTHQVLWTSPPVECLLCPLLHFCRPCYKYSNAQSRHTLSSEMTFQSASDCFFGKEAAVIFCYLPLPLR